MRIGEVAAATGTTTKTLRFYEDSALLHPAGRIASDAVAQLHQAARTPDPESCPADQVCRYL